MNTEQCRGCAYWKSLSGGFKKNDRVCHHLLKTGLMRKREGDRCLSRKAKGRTKKGQSTPPQKREGE